MFAHRTMTRVALPLAVAAGLGLGLACTSAASFVPSPFAPAQAWAQGQASYNDGEYTAEGKGIGGRVPVTVTIEGGVITGVEVGDNSETQGIGSKAIEQLPDAIVEANGTEGVDAVSGASVTSKAILTAVEDCLEQAGGGGAAENTKTSGAKADSKDTKSSDKAESSSAEGQWYNDGEYTAEGKGIGGRVPVTVTIEGGVITGVEVGDNSETQGIGSKAIEQLPDAIVEANGTEGVDAVSGASVTSKAIFTAVDDCLEQAGTTDEKPETTMSDRQSSPASSDRNTNSSDSLVTSADDHLGTTYFGKMAVTIPDTYTCEKFEQGSTSDGTRSAEAAYTRMCSTTGAILVKEIFLEGVAGAFLDDPCTVIEALVVKDLQLTSDDGYCETDLEAERLSNDSYFGIYTIERGGIDYTVIGGGAVDEDGNLLLIRVFAVGDVEADDGVEVIATIEGAYAPGGSSSSPSSSSSLSQSSGRSSYTPTRGEQNALETAHDYLDAMPFSPSGLKDQLEYEGYTSSEAEYAVENCGADWDEQAVLMAEDYLDAMPFSRSGLIDQLEYEGFTYSQASAAATAAGL